MQNKPSEERLAKGAYDWLRVSPLLTVFTLYIVASLEIGKKICYRAISVCDPEFTFTNTFANSINIGLGVLVSACWHFILLQYVNNKDSEFVRRHGKQALTYAGIRTAIAFFGIVVDFFLNADGGLACITIIVLLILWFTFPNVGMKKIKKELEADLSISRDNPTQAPVHEYNEGSANEAITLTNEKTKQEEETKIGNSTPQNNQEILDKILSGLKSKVDSERLAALTSLREINFSSQAIRVQLEKISLQDANSSIREAAQEALSLPSNQAVQKHLIANQLEKGVRLTILNEIKKWVSDGLLNEENAKVIQKRYDFDFSPTPQAESAPIPTSQKLSQPEKVSVPEKPAQPPVPQPTLLQTLTSESAIKIYLYLGAFFVVAAASFVGWAIPELRLPILLIGTFLFGGFSLAIKKRLPQPSFALFIVFSFLILITANNLEDGLQTILNYTTGITSVYWVVIGLILAAIWGIGTRLYESRLFSITAFGAFVFAFMRIGGIFEARAEVYTLLASIATFSGLGGVWLIKKWKDASFALPLFLSTQFVQGITLVASLSVFDIKLVDPASSALWNLIPFFVWAFGAIFIIISDRLYPFFAYPWLFADTLIPLPWFIAATFDLESLGSTTILFIWGAILSISSEVLYRNESLRKFSLPFLIASLLTFGLSLMTGFSYQTWLGMGIAFGIAIILAALHVIRTHWWLWTMALFNFVIAYFAFFQLEFIKNFDIFFGYQILIIGLLFLLPDLFLKKDWNDNRAYRFPLRILGGLLVGSAVIFVLSANESNHAAICFAVLTLFTFVYAIAYQTSWLAYIPAGTFPVSILYALDHFNISNVWLILFTVLTFLYFLFGILIRSKENWSMVLRNSALVLASIIAFVALINYEKANGWYVLAISLLFIVEMVLRKNGLFEIGAPIFFSMGAFLLMRDFGLDEISYQFLVYSLIWLLADLFVHLAFKHPRPLSILVRGIGAFIAAINLVILFRETNAVAATGFGIYALLFLIINLIYKNSTLFYAFTLTLPIFVAFLFRNFGIAKWIHPVIMIAFGYYIIGFVLRNLNRLTGWDLTLLYSALGLGVLVSLASPSLGGVDAVIPVAVAATLWAVEAFIKKNAWLAFPANGLYLLAYFILLGALNVKESQFYSIGTALLGLIQHYLLVRANSKTGAFLMGMLSQFVLLGTAFYQMVVAVPVPEMFKYCVFLFFESIAVLVYGIVIRSRSLTIFPIGFVVLGVITFSFLATGGLGTIFIVGCTGILLLGLGIAAVLMRERIAKLGERMSEWQA